MASSIKLIVGLANPGTEYELTRHNAGAWFIDNICQQQNLTLRTEKKFFANIAKLTNSDCYVAIPNTYMNESGRAIAAIAKFYKLSAEEILVAHDELDLAAGDIKMNIDRGHAGHNGLRDIIKATDSKNFYRLRIGIGRPKQQSDVVDYVLKRPSNSDREAIDAAIDKALDTLPLILNGELNQAIKQLNTKGKTADGI